MLAGAVAGARLLVLVVEKARKCLDFAGTLYGAHFAIVMLYSGFAVPRWTWWLCHGAALVLMVVLGEYLCSRRELQEIPLSTAP